jgi:hypothetical protein
MCAFTSLFAFALLATPPDVMELPDPAKLHGPLAADLQALALHLELLDPREVKYTLVEADAFASDLKELQGRYVKLADAPTLAECRRFPSREVAGDLLASNRAYRESLSHRLAVDAIHAEELRAALHETDQLYRVWDLVRDAHCEGYYVKYRREALQQLRELVGPHAFYSGQLPPHVPLWRIPIAE